MNWFWIFIALFIFMVASAVIMLPKILRKMAGRRAEIFQTNLVTRHLEEVQTIYQEMRGWRHDYHSHIQTMKAYRALGQEERLDNYLNELDADLTSLDKLIRSGNVMVDAALNAKLSLARTKDIALTVTARVPVRLSVKDVDLCVIVGNLMDNAMEACLKLPKEKRFIRVYMDIKGENLYLSVTNSSSGKPNKFGERFMSSKAGSHGFGLLRMEGIVRKYGGIHKTNGEMDAFTAEILLPI
ncbi:MAG: putative two-component sensor kinase [Herbinix sp.]|jgi:sensor histidine kinase regulating citrate/malate metabolism|nr:putative two-component sensor kinase [Herbinix sp.]